VRRLIAVAVLILLGLALPALALAAAEGPGFAPPEPMSPNAERINDSYYWVAIFTGAILIVVEASLIWFIVRYRADGRRRRQDGAQIHGNTRLEIAWTVVPVLIVAAIGSFVFYKLPGIADIPEASAEGGRTDVTVKGYRYYWNYEYENGVIAVDRLRAPVGQNVRLAVTAPDFDVIHSWWIPELGGKFDAIPGQVNETWFNAKAPGIYRGQCAEFCGIQHAAMTAEVEAMPREEFEDWLDEEARAQEAGTSKLGEETFAGACAKCHGLSGEGDIGPKLQGNQLLGDAAAVEKVVRQGRGAMPPVGADWSDRQMDALTDYLDEELLGGR
jgi:cytochrome c oxidase subunit II